MRKKSGKRNKFLKFVIMLLLIFGAVQFGMNRLHFGESAFQSMSSDREENPEYWRGCPPIDVQLLTVNEYSRPGIERSEVNAIVIHYTANPGSTAQANRDYFENLKDTHTTKASSHFVIGLDGELIQLIPSREIAYANYPRNDDTISIECCHPDDTGKFNQATRQTTVELAAWLCKAFDVSPENVIRHYDVNGKNCPMYYAEHEDEWIRLKEEIETQYDTLMTSS